MFPAAGWQHTLMKKEFTPEGMLFGRNTLYFANPNASPLAKEFVAWYEQTRKDYRVGGSIRATSPSPSYKAAVGEGVRRRRAAPGRRQDDIIDAMVGLSVDSLGGEGYWRKDHIADQTFVQGFTTHKNAYGFVTLGSFETMSWPICQKPPRRELLGVARRPRSSRSDRVGWCGLLRASLSAACFTPPFCSWSRPGCSSFSVSRKIVNLACGSFYALGAYFGITFLGYAHQGLGLSALADPAGPDRRRSPARLHRAADRTPAAHRLRPRRELSAAAHVCARAHVPGRVPLHLGLNPRSLDGSYLIYGAINTPRLQRAGL